MFHHFSLIITLIIIPIFKHPWYELFTTLNHSIINFKVQNLIIH